MADENLPDMERLKELSAEMHELRGRGALTHAEWERIATQASKHVGDKGWMLEAFLNWKPENETNV